MYNLIVTLLGVNSRPSKKTHNIWKHRSEYLETLHPPHHLKNKNTMLQLYITNISTLNQHGIKLTILIHVTALIYTIFMLYNSHS